MLSQFLAPATLGLTAAATVWYLLTDSDRSNIKTSKQFPSLPLPFPYIFQSNLVEVSSSEWPLRLHQLNSPTFVRLPGFPSPVLMVIDPQLVKQLLSKCSTRPLIGDPSFTNLFGNTSIFRVVGSEHRRLRALCGRAFAKAALGFHFERLKSLAIKSLNDMAEACEAAGAIDSMAFVQAYSYKAVCVFLVGDDPDQLEALELLENDFIAFSTGFLAEFRPRWIDYFSGNRIPKAIAARSRIIKKCTEMAATRRKQLNGGQVFTDSLSAFIESKDTDGNGFTDLEIAELFLDLLFAGFETTSKQLATVMYHLTHSITDSDMNLLMDEVANPALIESETTFSSKGVHLEAFIKESMRMFPVLPAPTRILVEDVVLDGVHLPAGTIVDAVREQGLFIPNAQKFSLSNFIGHDAFDKKQPTDFVPFGMGEGMCLAFLLAKLEMKLIVAEALRFFVVHKSSSHKSPIFTHFPSKTVRCFITVERKQ
ncbi:hypothetical protein HDU79_009798 [Rhizoclosmatium sp. JEL0117]|nr:hypothetical protein HDU79_009798 [Rhizoclosmatium sp. JEL0117]